MSKKTEDVNKLERIRGRVFVDYCLKKSGCKNQSRLGIYALAESWPAKDTWSKYKNGNSKPTEFIDLINKFVPGAKATWLNGPDALDLPLWAVLEGNEEVCNELVNAELVNQLQIHREIWWLLANRLKPVSSLTVAEKAQALLEASIPSHYWIRTTEDKGGSWLEDLEGQDTYVDLCSERDKYFLTLNELVRRLPNSLATTYSDGIHYLKYGYGVDDYRILEKKRLVALISLIVLCYNSSEKGLDKVHSFLKNGIHQALIDNFGVDIAEYVNSSTF